MKKQNYDVIIVGAGNAALCAALSAREQVAKVLVLEKAPIDERCGNSYFTDGGFRFVNEGLADMRRDILRDLSPAEVDIIEHMPGYTRQQYYDDMMSVTDHQANEELTNILIDNSRDTVAWIARNHVRFLPAFNRQSYISNGRHRFYGGVTIAASGGGAGLATMLAAAAEKAGIEIRYQTPLRRLIQDNSGAVVGVEVRGPEGIYSINASAVVLASGGFEANPEWRARYLGVGWDLCRVRGTRHNTGDGIRAALDIGAEPFGNWSSCHAVQWDLSSPPFGDRVVLGNYQKHSYKIGIMVNLDGNRFVDEGAALRLFTYAKYGAEVLKQRKRIGVQIFDGKLIPMLRDEYRIRQITKVEADSIEGLAQQLGIEPAALAKTVREFNAACDDTPFNREILDGKKTTGITPPKSNWAVPIDTPPYVGYVTTCGITFTYGGLHVNQRGEVQDTTDGSIPGLYAAGELVGGIFCGGYPGGAGLMSGAVFGRLSGREAGLRAKAGSRRSSKTVKTAKRKSSRKL